MLSTSPFISENKIPAYSSGELDGLTFAIKDNIDVANEDTGYGSPDWAETHDIPVINAICLEQLLSAGGNYCGKTKTDELAYSLIGVNEFYGTPLNPKAPNRVPGGSSSGSASAVASQLVDFAIGTDTAGSVRVPASNCGIWGYRPSYGLIATSGVLAQAPSFDTVGVFASNGNTLEKVMQVLLSESPEQQNINSTICFLNDMFEISSDPIKTGLSSILNKITQTSQVETLSLAQITDKSINCNWLFELSAHLLSVEVYNTFGTWVEKHNPKLSTNTLYSFANYAKAASRQDIQSNLFIMKQFSKKLNDFLNKGNILCFPTTLDLAPKLDEINQDFLFGDYIPRTLGLNAISILSRTPQITIPVTEFEGVPIGLSFLSGYGQDMKLINFCNQLIRKLGL